MWDEGRSGWRLGKGEGRPGPLVLLGTSWPSFFLRPSPPIGPNTSLISVSLYTVECNLFCSLFLTEIYTFFVPGH